MADSITRWKSGTALRQCNVIDGDGMLMNIIPVRIRDVFDGTSNTLMVGELTGGEPGSTNRQRASTSVGSLTGTIRPAEAGYRLQVGEF